MARARVTLCPAALLVALAIDGSVARAQNPAEVFELPSVEVIATTPLPGLGTALKDVPANVQVFARRDLARQRPSDLPQFLELNANSIGLGSAQGNPYQSDLNFRGFAASPLLGTPQGMSVFQDGVRVNEAFGDVVNWDLIPSSAISSMQLIPGSNPVFGLNTLGGALAIYTKSGAQYPGASVELTGGSFGRKVAELEYGGARDRLDWFATGHVSDERGWAEHNPSRVKQFFGKVGYQDDITDLDVSLTLADNTLQGAQTLPLSFLDTPRQSYTYPDQNDNRLSFVTVKGSRFIDEQVLLGGTAYVRDFRTTNLSSNVNDRYGQVNPMTGDIETNQATNDRSVIAQTSWGLGTQLTIKSQVALRRYQLSLGASADFGDTRFQQTSQPANFGADRGAIAIGAFSPQTDVAAKNRYLGVYASNTLALSDTWTLTLAGRYNHARISIVDRSDDAATDTSSISGAHTFARFNPAIGLNFNPSTTLTAYASYNEGMRAPTPIELTCADASAPCKLPNLFLADPPLKKVVSKSVEIGARGSLGSATQWGAALYRTDLDDDIQFIASGSGAVNAGFFQNVGKTRRQGAELSGSTKLGRVSLNLRYSRTEATFRTRFSAASPNNSTADLDGAIVVGPGNRIPGIPADAAKLRADYEVNERWSLGMSVAFASSQYARGDENNRDRHGSVPSYTVVYADARYQASAQWQFFAQVANLFDRRYENFGILGSNVFTGPDRSFGPALGVAASPEQFRAVGAPRGLWLGMRYAFDAKHARSHND